MREFSLLCAFFTILAISACATSTGSSGDLTPTFEGAIPVDGFIKFN